MPVANPLQDMRSHDQGYGVLLEEADWLAAALREDEASGYTTPEEYELAKARKSTEAAWRASLVVWARPRGWVFPLGVGVRIPSVS